MRNFPSLYVIIFLIIYLGITYFVINSVLRLFTKKNKNRAKLILIIYSLLIITSFVYLYIYPNQPRYTRNYTYYFYFNSILFIDIIVKLPILIFSLFGYISRKIRILLISGLIISTGLMFTMIYGLVLGNKELKVTHYEIPFPNLPKEFNNFRIVQISDIHLGSFQKTNPVLNKTASYIQKLSPDLVLFTGDLVNNFAYEVPYWEPVLKKITSVTNCYSILGNHDYGDYTRWKSESEKQKNFNAIVNYEKKAGFKLLRNENTVIKLNNDSIFLIGVENWGNFPFPKYADLNKAMKNVPENAYKILMSHDPAHWESKIQGKQNIELTLSGHTHGLQWGLKFAGIPFSLAYLIRKDWGGLYQNGKSFLYVNTGLGTVGIPWRIDMPPELTVITLKRI